LVSQGINAPGVATVDDSGKLGIGVLEILRPQITLDIGTGSQP
jgi:hypothetical protein